MINVIPVAKPPWSKLGKSMESQVRKALYDFDLMPQNGKLAIALSGGKDSLTLLFLMHALRGCGFDPFDITAIHVSGEYSCGSSLSLGFLKPICEELGIELVIAESTQNLSTLECYTCSRERRSLIFDAARERGISHVAFGHHRDDSIQTLLLNLFHKGEFAANLPKVEMIHYGVTIIRPLIYISESDILNFAKLHGFNRITCQCPVGQTSRRQDVRRLLDQIERVFPHVRSNLSLAAHNYGSDKAKTP